MPKKGHQEFLMGKLEFFIKERSFGKFLGKRSWNNCWPPPKTKAKSPPMMKTHAYSKTSRLRRSRPAEYDSQVARESYFWS